jgi:hypothetical protein
VETRFAGNREAADNRVVINRFASPASHRTIAKNPDSFSSGALGFSQECEQRTLWVAWLEPSVPDGDLDY